MERGKARSGFENLSDCVMRVDECCAAQTPKTLNGIPTEIETVLTFTFAPVSQ